MRHRYWLYPAIVLLGALVLASCTAIRDVEEVAAELKKVAESFKQADTNQDGKYESGEILTWVAAGGGAVLAAAVEFLRRKLKSAKTQLWTAVATKADKPSV